MDIMKKVDSYDFIFFLQYLVDECNWTAREIIGVVEKPHSYQKEFDEYIQYEEDK